jgi:AcrR family transcriptional regulator
MATTPYHHGDLKNALIQAGVDVLTREGLGGLSLRKVAKQAGVSHAAPYSHFADKQALIAAISTEGFKQLYSQIQFAFEIHREDPENLIIETAWAYVQFALNTPDRFKLMFSSVLEKEKEYAEFVKASQDNFAQLVDIIETCQQAGFIKPGQPDVAAVSVWSTVHGFTSLLLEGQISHTVLEKAALKDLLSLIYQNK